MQRGRGQYEAFSPGGAKQVFVMAITDATDACASLASAGRSSPVTAGKEASGS